MAEVDDRSTKHTAGSVSLSEVKELSVTEDTTESCSAETQSEPCSCIFLGALKEDLC